MIIAIPHFRGRVSPVFDVAVDLCLIETRDGRESRRQDMRLSGGGAFARAGELAGKQVEVVICGAISRLQQTALENAGIRVVPFICGNMEEVLAAFMLDTLTAGAFQMPGCCGRRRQNRGGCRRGGKRATI